MRKNIIKNSYDMRNSLFAPTFVWLQEISQRGHALQLKKGKTRPLPGGPPWQSVEFQRELDWCENWSPGKSGEIEIPNSEDAITAPTDGSPTLFIESEECEPGTGIECGCCFTEYVSVSRHYLKIIRRQTLTTIR